MRLTGTEESRSRRPAHLDLADEHRRPELARARVSRGDRGLRAG